MSATLCVPSLPDVGVIIVAGGRGARLGGGLPKQFLPIAGIPMLLRSIRLFAAHPAVLQLVVVLPAEHVQRPPDWLAPHVSARLQLARGGLERADSVANGLAALATGVQFVLVHDAARPFATRGLVDRVIAASRRGVAAVPAVALADTVKELDPVDQRLVSRTIPRDRLVRAQTPQGFPRALLEQAHQRARQDGVSGTDDAALAERIGAPVETVPGEARNIKITTPEDLALAEWLAGQEP